MVHYGIRNDSHLPSFQLHSPAEVYLFHMGEKSFVESSQGVINAASYHQASSCGPQYVGRGVVLSVILFQTFHHASAAEWKAELVNVSSGCTCIFKFLPFLPAVQLRRAGSAVRMAVHPLDKRTEPVL